MTFKPIFEVPRCSFCMEETRKGEDLRKIKIIAL